MKHVYNKGSGNSEMLMIGHITQSY